MLRYNVTMADNVWSLRALCRFLFCVSVTLLLLYALSTGPVVRLMMAGTIPESVVETVYSPITWLADTKYGAKPVATFVEWYGEKLWRWKFL